MRPVPPVGGTLHSAWIPTADTQSSVHLSGMSGWAQELCLFGWESRWTSLYSCGHGCAEGWVLLPQKTLSLTISSQPNKTLFFCLKTDVKCNLVLMNWKPAWGLFYPENKRKTNLVPQKVVRLTSSLSQGQINTTDKPTELVAAGILHQLPTLPPFLPTEISWSAVIACSAPYIMLTRGYWGFRDQIVLILIFSIRNKFSSLFCLRHGLTA